ncbi:MAG TPA: lysylphosphatidylglycerol synthase domain-containing protein [Gaiellaceae bacterium]|nr:lysylphosphatidylglycerol synthase domain-containing protein [Gaiellaceae bacterium]
MRVWRSSVLGLGVLAASFAVLAATQLGRGSVENALAVLQQVRPGWLLLAGVGFGGSLLCSAAAWGAGLRACGGSADYVDIASRYAVGSLVNSATPAHVGGAVRLGLLSRTLPGRDPVLRACGVGTAIGAARAVGLGLLIFAAAAVGRVPLWPAPILIAAVAAVVAIGMRLSSRVKGRVAAVLQAFRSPRGAFELSRWVGYSYVFRVGAGVAIVASLGISSPLTVALVLLGALSLAGLLPLTPGNFGAGAGAATIALHGTGVALADALALGVTFQAVETGVSLLLGLAGSAMLAAPGTRIRRWSFVTVAVAGVALAAMVGVVSVELV